MLQPVARLWMDEWINEWTKIQLTATPIHILDQYSQVSSSVGGQPLRNLALFETHGSGMLRKLESTPLNRCHPEGSVLLIFLAAQRSFYTQRPGKDYCRIGEYSPWIRRSSKLGRASRVGYLSCWTTFKKTLASWEWRRRHAPKEVRRIYWFMLAF